MPIAMDPDARFRYVLESDRDRPDPLTWIFRVRTCRAMREIIEAVDKIDALQSGTEAGGGDVLSASLDLLRSELVAVENGPGGFDLADLDALITPAEVNELITALIRQGQEPADAKKSKSPSRSSSASSANPAKQGRRAGNA